MMWCRCKGEYRLTGFRYLQPVPAASYRKTRDDCWYLFAFTFNRQQVPATNKQHCKNITWAIKCRSSNPRAVAICASATKNVWNWPVVWSSSAIFLFQLWYSLHDTSYKQGWLSYNFINWNTFSSAHSIIMLLAKIIKLQWCSAVCTVKCKQTLSQPITAKDSHRLVGKK